MPLCKRERERATRRNKIVLFKLYEARSLSRAYYLLVTCKTILLGDRLHNTRLFLNFDVSQSQHLLDPCTVLFIYILFF